MNCLRCCRDITTLMVGVTKLERSKDFSFTRVGVYKQIRYVLLPALWKDNMAIERKKQKN